MKKLLNEYTEYLKKVLGIHSKLVKWEMAKKLPFYLKDRYDYYITEILQLNVIMVIPYEEIENTPAQIKNDFESIRKLCDFEPVYLDRNIVSYNRNRLVQYKIPFVVPNNQLYLPHLGIDFHEYFRKHRIQKKSFSPSAQMVLLYILNNKEPGDIKPVILATTLGYSSMTISRAFNEIENAGIGSCKNEGRERLLIFTEKPEEIWQKASSLMKNPIEKTVWVKFSAGKADLPDAGLTALSRYSMLAGSSHITKAISTDSWKNMKSQKGIEELPFKEKDALELQIWKYNPCLLSNQNTVDPFSLYLSLNHEKDERIQKALQEMMENYSW